MYGFSQPLHTGTVLLSVALRRAFLILLLPGPQSFHVLLSFFIQDFCHTILGWDRSTQASRGSFSLAAWTWSLYSNLCGLAKGLRVRYAPLLAPDCCWWHDVVPRRGTQSALQWDSKHLTADACIFGAFQHFLSPLCTRLLCTTALASPGYSLGSPVMLEKTVACHRALCTGLTSTYPQAKQHRGGGGCPF